MTHREIITKDCIQRLRVYRDREEYGWSSYHPFVAAIDVNSGMRRHIFSGAMKVVYFRHALHIQTNTGTHIQERSHTHTHIHQSLALTYFHPGN